MSTLAELHAEMTNAVGGKPRGTPLLQPIKRGAVSSIVSLHHSQIHSLVQRLFFCPESKPVRHVGFAPVEESTRTEPLCLEVATALAEEGRYDVALIDAYPGSVPLQTELQLPSPTSAESSWLIAPHLWIVARQSWLSDTEGHNLTDQNLASLEDVTSDFDFTILRFGPISWHTASIAKACDGLALVLTANKTRRIVATRIKDQLRKAGVPLLGTVLADRSFPVPEGLYRIL